MTTDHDHAAAVEAFFSEFTAASDNEDWDKYGDLFVEQFLNVDPSRCAPLAREDLIAFLPQRRAFVDSVGATGTRLVDVQADNLDDRHVLARTKWEVVFDREHAPVELDTTFLLRHHDRWRIALYLNHGSLPELLGAAAR